MNKKTMNMTNAKSLDLQGNQVTNVLKEKLKLIRYRNFRIKNRRRAQSDNSENPPISPYSTILNIP